MPDYDLVIAGGTVVTPADMFQADIGVKDGRIAALGAELRGDRTIDAQGLLVMPGGVDSHCHIEQLQPQGGADEETFVTGSTSALAGGTTTVITFSTQFKGRASSGRWPSTAAGPKRRWSTTASTRSSPTPRTR